MKPEVTVLIPAYNAEKYILDAVNSMLRQTLTDWKLIIIDDASTDKSIDLISPHIDGSRIKLVRNTVNLGPGQTMNVGLSHVETPYVVQLDADDWYYPYTLEVLLEEMKKQPEDVALVSGNMHVVMENPFGPRIDGSIIKSRSFSNKYDYLLANVSAWPRFYRTSALKEIGGWPTADPFQGRYMEDRRVLTRLIEKYRFHWIDIPLYNYRRHGTNQTLRLNVYNDIIEWTARDALKRWGDRYEPLFTYSSDGWKLISDLKLK
jgi:glycosyltransferase involved in cell wall biosynthesis